MEAYHLLERLGSGSFSVVWKAQCRATGALCAIKELLDPSLEWSAVQQLPEVLAARLLPVHEGLLRLHAVHRLRGRVFMVMDYCQGSLLDVVVAGGSGLPEPQVRHVMRRLLSALAALHASGHMHRDIKPENVLLGAAGSSGARPVLGDFGQLRSTGPATGSAACAAAAHPPLTPYVSTRWYRAPEVLLRAPLYGPAIDVWALGALMCELLSGRPAFPGTSEADQLFRLCAVLGAPSPAAWPSAQPLAAAAGFSLPPSSLAPRGLGSLLPAATSSAALRAVSALLAWCPEQRPSAAAALAQLEFFAGGQLEVPVAAPGLGWGGGGAAGGAASSGGGAGGAGEQARARAEAAARQQRLVEELAAGEEGGGGGKEAEGGGGRGSRATGKEADSDEEGSPAPAAAAGAGGGEGARGGRGFEGLFGGASVGAKGGLGSGVSHGGKEVESSEEESSEEEEGGGYRPSCAGGEDSD